MISRGIAAKRDRRVAHLRRRNGAAQRLGVDFITVAHRQTIDFVIPIKLHRPPARCNSNHPCCQRSSCACAVWLMTVTCVEELSEELLALVAMIEKGFGEGIAPGAR